MYVIYRKESVFAYNGNMTDNFNENGFTPEENGANEQEQPEVNKESGNNDVFAFMTGASFYNNVPEENKDEKETGFVSESVYDDAPKENSEPSNDAYTEQNVSYDSSENIPPRNTYTNVYGNPEQNGDSYRPQEPVKPYDFGKNNHSAPYGYEPQKPKRFSAGKIIAFAIIALCVVIGLKAVLDEFSSLKPGGENPTTTLFSQEGGVTTSPGDQVQISPTQAGAVAQLNSVQVAEKASPSVVGVMTYVNGQLSGEGSGVAMSVDGSGKYTYIITCAHVISEKGVTYGVLTAEKKNYEAELVAYDVRTDIGVLKVEATDIPLAEFGDSKSLRVGETIYAIGNPGGSEFFGSFTDGIISAIDRSISGTYTMTCIQHNAAINPGNSGGALVNSAGQVIGINSSKIAATDYEGMGFAVPMSIVKPVVDSLIQYKYVPNRPKLGIEYASVSAYQLYSMVVAIKGLPSGSLVIAGISSDSSLANTDAQVGDLIIAVNGKPMDSSDVLLDLINTGAVGDTLTLTLCRVENRTYKTTTFDVTITLVEDKGEAEQEEETTAAYNDGGYYYGGQPSFEDFFNEYFGF